MGVFLYVVRAEASSRELLVAYERWLLAEGHVAAVVEAGALSGEVMRVDGEPPRIEVHYAFGSRVAFEAYEREHAPRLRAEGLARFPSGLTFSRAAGPSAGRCARAPLEVIPVPCLRDNYAYLVADRARGEAIVVDPSEPGPVLAQLRAERLSLRAIWCTHHHFDHVGGNDALAEATPGLEVLGSTHDLAENRIPRQTRGLSDGEEVVFGGHVFSVLAVPGHTLGAIAYVSEADLFTGDTLFAGGCGRVFEGTMPMMRASLARLRARDGHLRLWCGHEYTERNLEFAAAVEPASPAVGARLERVRALRAKEAPTVGGRLADERDTNPFFRWDAPAVRAFAAARGDATTDDWVFARVREAKDAF